MSICPWQISRFNGLGMWAPEKWSKEDGDAILQLLDEKVVFGQASMELRANIMIQEQVHGNSSFVADGIIGTLKPSTVRAADVVVVTGILASAALVLYALRKSAASFCHKVLRCMGYVPRAIHVG
jgi:hypothetical protein